MTKLKVQTAGSLMDEMRAVARGDRKAPRDAAKPSFETAEAIVRLLTPENRKLMAAIRDRKPKSISELVKFTGRAQPNLTRTLAKLEAAGLLKSTVSGKRKTPQVCVKKLFVEIDPYSPKDKLRSVA